MKNMTISHSLVLAVLGLATAAPCLSSPASAEVIHVPAGGDIQAALDIAQDGDIIQLEAGLYEPVAPLTWTDLDLSIRGVLDEKGEEPVSIIDGQDKIQLVDASGGSLDLYGVHFRRARVERSELSDHRRPLDFPRTLQLNRCRVSECTHIYNGDQGGSVHAIAYGILGLDHGGMSHCTIDSNLLLSTYSGSGLSGAWGVIWLTGYGTTSFDHCIFINNRMEAAGTGAPVGGSLYCYGGPLQISNSMFVGNTTHGHNQIPAGVVAFNIGEGMSRVTDTTFSDNDGAMSFSTDQNIAEKASFSLERCVFTGNISTEEDYSGGLTVKVNSDEQVDIDILDCTFSNNETPGEGGGLNFSEGWEYRITLANCEFTGNRAMNGGGASLGPWYFTRKLRVTDCFFQSNSATENGGGLYLRWGPSRGAVVHGSTFDSNSARVGGGIGSLSPVGVYDSVFLRNTATYGGGCYAEQDLIVAACGFEENSCYDEPTSINGGGAVFCGSGTILGSDFRSNTAESFGAAILASGPTTLAGCSLIGNRILLSGLGGGALDLQNSSATGFVTTSNFCDSWPRDFGLLHGDWQTGDGNHFNTCEIPGNTFTVCADGCDFDDLQTAINNTETGDTIEVHEAISSTTISLGGRRIELLGIPTKSGNSPSIEQLHTDGLESNQTAIRGFQIGALTGGNTPSALSISDCMLDAQRSHEADLAYMRVTDSSIEPRRYRIDDIHHRDFERCSFSEPGPIEPAIFRDCDFGKFNWSWEGGPVIGVTKMVFLDCAFQDCEDSLTTFNAVFLGETNATSCCDTCVGDLDCDGDVDGQDLGLLFVAWGSCPDCQPDLNGDGVVNGQDLGILFVGWGPCD